MSLSRKAINFDLSTEALKKHFGENTAPAYAKIKAFMLENGFEHRQYSGYASKEKIDEYDISKLAEKMAKKFTWLSSCIQEFDVTDIGEQYSLSHIFRKSITKDKSLSKENPQKDSAKERLRQQVKKISEKHKNDKNPKDKGIER